MKANGHANPATDVVVGDDVSLAAAADAAGGAWVGSNVIKAHLAQIKQQQQINTAILHAQIHWQTEVTRYQAEADAAQAELIRCWKEGDHVGAAAANRAFTIAILHLIRLGVE